MKLPRYSNLWAPEYIRQSLGRLQHGNEGLRRIWVTIADHYEPMWHGATFETAIRRVALWRSKWPQIARRCDGDSAGNPPRYTFFFPEEEYHPVLMELLAEMTHQGLADVEVHLHHDGEGRSDFVDRIGNFCVTLHSEHGLLRKWNDRITFGFIHGNWALDNSRPDGRWCGLNDEITLLRDLGCYADFTMPSGDSPTQARLINTLYYCTDDPKQPKSYDTGNAVMIGSAPRGDLLMIPGPLGIRWRERLLPRLETGELCRGNLATPYRVKRWVDLAPRLGTDSFVKLFTHGAQERHSSVLLQGELERAFNLLGQEARRQGCAVYFVSAWQMFLAIEAIRQQTDPIAAVYPNIARKMANQSSSFSSFAPYNAASV
jgi:hypothetical protein